MVKVSIIVPVYNAAPYLRECLDSLVSQALKDIEILCIDDGSTDTSLHILQTYTSDNRVKVIALDKNGGVSAARNIGIRESCGEYIGFVDSDDFVDLNFYEALYNKTTEAAYDVVKGDILCYNAQTHETSREKWNDLNTGIKLHKAYFYCAFTTAIYKRSFILSQEIQFPEDINNFEDPVFSVKVALCCNALNIVDNVYYYYRKNYKNIDEIYSPSVRHTHLRETIEGCFKIFGLLHEIPCTKTHYIVVYNFFIKQIFDWCAQGGLSSAALLQASRALYNAYEFCCYKSQLVDMLFLSHRPDLKNAIASMLLRERMTTSGSQEKDIYGRT